MNKRSFIKLLGLTALIPFAVKASYKNMRQGETIRYYKLPDGTLTESYPETIEDLIRMMEERIPVGEPTSVKWAVTGEEYKEFIVGCAEPTETKIKALISFQWRTFLKQVRENPYGKLYWRTKPEYIKWAEDFDTSDSDLNPFCKGRIYARYLVSNKPEKTKYMFNPDYLTDPNDWHIAERPKYGNIPTGFRGIK